MCLLAASEFSHDAVKKHQDTVIAALKVCPLYKQQFEHISQSLIKPKFHYADFHQNFPAGKVADTNHESRGHEPSRHVEMFATEFVTSPRQTRLCRSNGIYPLQCTGKVGDKVGDTLLRTQITKVRDTNHESRQT